ncbi:MAG: hypothetical protein M3Y65_17035 [Pseudomonadota bacterium]|nr:hypothetical protein [Pseudomonadota bacterium]
MNVRKNFEGLFLVAAAVGIFASYASAETFPKPLEMSLASKAPAAAVPAVSTPAIPTVVVIGHRLTAAEKARLG